MRIRIASAALALIAAMCLATPAVAASGYGTGTTGSYVSSDSGGGSYTPTGSSSSPAPAAPTAPTAAQIASTASAAIKRAVAASSDKATVYIVNAAEVPASTLKDIFAQAAKAGINDAVVAMDIREGGVVLSRIYIDAATAAKLKGTIDYSVAVKGGAVKSAVNTFEKFFDNKVAAVSLGQKGAFGADIKMAVKADLSGLDTSSLVFYAYDKATGKYARLAIKYKLDSKGYLHFTTPVGGVVIVTDKPLARK